MADKKSKTDTDKVSDEVIEKVDAESGTEAVAKTVIADEEKTEEKTTPAAKAGKRSPKAIRESEEVKAKEDRKKSKDSEENAKPKQQQNSARPKVERRGKKYQEAAKSIDKTKTYPLAEAIDLAIKSATTKFDSTIEAHVRLNVDPKQADQNVRDTIVLPAGTGKKISIAVFGSTEDVATAKKAGADIAMEEEFLQKLEKEELDFDVLIATPSMMPKLGKFARTLGPRGLMPNPKSGTVTTDIKKAVDEAKAGKVEYRVDSTGIIHVAVGKVSFGKDKIAQNINALFSSIKTNKPASLKTTYVKTIHLTTSMGPSVKVSNSEI